MCFLLFIKNVNTWLCTEKNKIVFICLIFSNHQAAIVLFDRHKVLCLLLKRNEAVVQRYISLACI